MSSSVVAKAQLNKEEALLVDTLMAAGYGQLRLKPVRPPHDDQQHYFHSAKVGPEIEEHLTL